METCCPCEHLIRMPEKVQGDQFLSVSRGNGLCKKFVFSYTLQHFVNDCCKAKMYGEVKINPITTNSAKSETVICWSACSPIPWDFSPIQKYFCILHSLVEHEALDDSLQTQVWEQCSAPSNSGHTSDQ